MYIDIQLWFPQDRPNNLFENPDKVALAQLSIDQLVQSHESSRLRAAPPSLGVRRAAFF